MKGIMVNKHRIVHAVHDWNILKGKQRVLEMVPILYFSVVTRGNIIVFGHKFLAMAQKAYEYSCSQGSLFLMDGLKIFFWPIKLILPIKVVFKIFGVTKMNMIGLMFSRNFREYFSAWYEIHFSMCQRVSIISCFFDCFIITFALTMFLTLLLL